MKINGLSVPGVVLAFLVLNAISFAFYGMAFGEAWLASYGLSSDQSHAGHPLWRLAGPVAGLMAVIGLATVLKWRGWPDLPGSVATALFVGVFFAVPVLIYDLAYLPDHNLTAFLIDSGHLLAGWTAAGIVLSVVR